MGRRSKVQPEAATPPESATASTANLDAREFQGPKNPAPQLSGLDLLRSVVSLSSTVPVDQVCDDAAHELIRLREQVRRSPWPDSH